MLVSASVMAIAAYLTETMAIQWTAALVGSVVWLALMNSIGALMLLYVMIRRGEATKVASLFYLIPPVTEVMASATLGEIPSETALVGFALSAIGVYLSNRR